MDAQKVPDGQQPLSVIVWHCFSKSHKKGDSGATGHSGHLCVPLSTRVGSGPTLQRYSN